MPEGPLIELTFYEPYYFANAVKSGLEIIGSFLCLAKLHQGRDCLAAKCSRRRVPTSSWLTVSPRSICLSPFSTSRTNQSS